MMGFEAPVNMWQWKADLDSQFWGGAPPAEGYTPTKHYTYEAQASFPRRTEKPKSACQDIYTTRPGTVAHKEETRVEGRGVWREGRWRVVVKRALKAAGGKEDIAIGPRSIYAAFAVWDGDKGDRGGRKSISEWVVLDVTSGAGAARGTAGGATTAKPDGRRKNGSFSILPAVHAAEAGSAPSEPEPRVITVKAKRFEFMPSEIKLRKGERVTIRLESLDVTHGMYIDGYDISTKCNPTEVGLMTFTADKTGRFTFRCSETCGEFHPYMVGYLTVGPNSRFGIFTILTIVAGVVALGVVLLAAGRGRGAAKDAGIGSE
jgi:cytochrome c oxidase subunit 2